ncbi:anti-sigma-K factor RskA [Tamaricihabitans halophyticus]|uniref:Regulator of SigK n=1 Tax=Tamaricihabitans halophyticus TaxID=1262583 RepID=A0A4R2Q7N8_9PSEU|nr:anti-sigma factor [Tamaricihabitans halophyticus]TCP44777.1 anti-sigma-K factor RskA [Tamaricihabitans halophyticus]
MTADMSKLTGAYAVDALGEAERVEFEQHLAVCAECAAEVRELRETVAQLGAANPVNPPDELKSRILTTISRTRQDPPMADPMAPASRQRSDRTTGWPVRIAAAAAAVALVAAGVLGGIAWQTQQQLEQAEQQSDRAAARSAELSAIMLAADTRVVRDSNGRQQGAVLVSEQLGKAAFLGDIAPPGDEHVHQLWLIGPDGAQSAGLLEPEASGGTPRIVELTPQVSQLGVTVEPTGGSPQPTTEPIMLMTLRA